MSTLKYYAKTNIGSRPSKRKSVRLLKIWEQFHLWVVSQLKQNVPGFFGVGTAETFWRYGTMDKVQDLYDNSLFFKTLLEIVWCQLPSRFSVNRIWRRILNLGILANYLWWIFNPSDCYWK
jgi:phosphoenolpyruvate carboxylase